MKRRLMLALGAALMLLPRLAHALSEEGYARPFDASVDGHRSDWLFNITTVMISILFILMVIILGWATLLHREGHKAHYEHGVGPKHLMMTAVIAAVIFFGVDGTMLIHSFADLQEAFWKFPTEADKPIEVEVLAQQWVWNIRQTGPDGKFNTADDIVTLNDLRVPKDRPVMIKLLSKDVIHSFYLPNFRIKQDAFPGTTTRIWFQAVQPGQFEIACAQHCGANHYKMEASITIDTPERYAAWEKAQVAQAERRFDPGDVDAHWGWEWEY